MAGSMRDPADPCQKFVARLDIGRAQTMQAEVGIQLAALRQGVKAKAAGRTFQKLDIMPMAFRIVMICQTRDDLIRLGQKLRDKIREVIVSNGILQGG